MMRVRLWVVAVVLVPGLTAGSSAVSGEKEKPSSAAFEKMLIELTNQERKKKDLGVVKSNETLAKAARAHAENMLRQEKMEHTLDGKNQFDRITVAGYKWMKAGENLAALDGDRTLAELMEAWMDSKSHRVNILDRDFSEIGVGIARDKKGKLWITQVFARPE